MDKPTIEEVVEKFGVNPGQIGNRYRGWGIVSDIEDEEIDGNAEIGYLVVRARDGGDNPLDPDACKHANFSGSSQDGFDCTYRYYYYRPLTDEEKIGARRKTSI